MKWQFLRRFWVHCFVFAITVYSLAKCDDESNEIITKNLFSKTDANLRRALLKALQELENEENLRETKQADEDKALEKAKASIFSLISESYGDGSISITPAPSLRFTTSKPSTKPNDNISLHLSSKLSLSDDNTEETNLLTSASEGIVFSEFDNKITEPKTRSTATRPSNNNLIFSEEKSSPKKEVSSTTTSTTTPSPPTSSTEEHEAKVEDVQFFQAPLVAAFTVHQDEKGLPKKVEPIFKSSTQSPPEKPKQQNSFYNQQQQEITRLQLALQERQEALKRQLLGLQKQSDYQEYLLRQGQKQNEESTRFFENKQQQFVRPSIGLQTPNFNQFQVPSVQPNNFFLPTIPPPISEPQNSGSISFSPSISTSYKEETFVHNPVLSTSQQLPLKEPVNFLNRPFIPFSQQILNTQLTPPSHFDNRFSQPVFNQNNNNRPVRNEGIESVGNFGQNSNFNLQNSNFNGQNSNFNGQNSNFNGQNSNFNGQNLNYYRPFINNHLNHLLRQSGIAESSKHEEDFNIVSKVLSFEPPKFNSFHGNGFNQQFYRPL